MTDYLVYVSKCGKYIALYIDKFTGYWISTNKPGRLSYTNLNNDWILLGEL